MDKFNELDLQGCVALEDVLTTAAFIQITQLEDFATTRGAKPVSQCLFKCIRLIPFLQAGDETFKPLPVNVEVDKLVGSTDAVYPECLKDSDSPTTRTVW